MIFVKPTCVIIKLNIGKCYFITIISPNIFISIFVCSILSSKINYRIFFLNPSNITSNSVKDNIYRISKTRFSLYICSNTTIFIKIRNCNLNLIRSFRNKIFPSITRTIRNITFTFLNIFASSSIPFTKKNYKTISILKSRVKSRENYFIIVFFSSTFNLFIRYINIIFLCIFSSKDTCYKSFRFSFFIFK